MTHKWKGAWRVGAAAATLACAVVLLVGPAGAQSGRDPAADRAEQEVMRRARDAAKREASEPVPAHQAPGSQARPAAVRPAPLPDRPAERPAPSARSASEVVQPRPAAVQSAPAAPAPPPPPAVTPRIAPDVVAKVWRSVFERPADTIGPAAPPGSEARIALGAKLFGEKRLSADHRMSCATCHDPGKGFIDERPRAQSSAGKQGAFNTPPIWNVGWAQRLGWAGRVGSLEQMIRAMIEDDTGMDGTVEAAAVWLSRDKEYVAAFARAFPGSGAPSPQSLVAALAAYMRTVVSPQTRFDRWVGGDERALSAPEREGFELFIGRAGCVSCHTGWRFSDDRTHPVANAKGAAQALKTPSLRELVWTAPYTHDGSVATLPAVLQNHAPGVAVPLTGQDRARLLAFLRTLSSDNRPREFGAAAR
jgi:cytochrome c peroxidase